MALLTYCYSFLQHNNLSLFYASNTKDQWKWFGRNQKQRIHNHYVYVCECCECSKFIELQNNFNKFSIILHALPTQRHKNAHTISVKSPVRCSSMKHMDQYFQQQQQQTKHKNCVQQNCISVEMCYIFIRFLTCFAAGALSLSHPTNKMCQRKHWETFFCKRNHRLSDNKVIKHFIIAIGIL